MQPQRGLPPRPSLPANPLPFNHPGDARSQQQGINVGAMAAQALTCSLANPYGQPSSYHSYTNANYHSYFTQVPRPMTTVQGYTLSSTYVPDAGRLASQSQSRSWQRGRTPNVHPNSRPFRSFTESPFPAPGDHRCTYDGCPFTGSNKTVEIHMMDRHLIFPPGWKNKQNDWDADPSLKGKPVPIPGTGVTLETPEAIDAWLAERRKRWPSNKHVEDKKRKAQEAVDRGEIDPSSLTLNIRKRRKMDSDSSEPGSRGGRGRGRGRGHGSNDRNYGLPDSGWRGRGRAGGSRPSTRSIVPTNVSPNVSRTHESLDRNAASSFSDDSTSNKSSEESDMDPVKDAVSSKVRDPDLGPEIPKGSLDKDGQQINVDDPPVASSPDLLITMCRPFPRRKFAAQPGGLPQNPFARPSLLRNLLLPEIRHTVSNLSQAIHFLVDNSFLEGVELKPGDVDSQRIKVLESASFADISNATPEE